MSENYGIPSPVESSTETLEAPQVQTEAAPPYPTPAATSEPASEFDEVERDELGKFKKRSRARSGHATPADVPVIQELTKANREGRERLEQLAKTGAPRVQKLAKEQLAIQNQLAEADAAPPKPVFHVPPPPPANGQLREPQLGEFADKDDPYGAWQRALAKYDRQQEALEAHAWAQQQQYQRTLHETEAYWVNVRQTHAQRLQAAVQANPQAAQLLQSVAVAPPPLLDLSIMLDNNSANVALFLASHPDELEELTLLTASQPVNQQNVDIIRRKLQRMMASVGTTGAMAPSLLPSKVPRPPTPVRTGPMKTGEAPPSDEESLEDHASRYGHLRLDKRRR
jgi:hypothetical protein